MKNIITTINGKNVALKNGKNYIILYATKDRPNDLKIIENFFYLDELYFDNLDETFDDCLINAVFTTEEWQHNLKQMVADFTFCQSAVYFSKLNVIL